MFSLVAAVLLGALALIVVALPANAHTPSFQVSCDKLAVNLQNYKVDTAKANQVVVTVGGVIVAAEEFGKNYTKTFNLPTHAAALPVQVGVIAGDAPTDPRLSPTWNALAKPCSAPAATENVSFTKLQGCDTTALNLTSLGKEAKAVVTRNGEKVWSGAVGANQLAGTGQLAAKAGDVFRVAYLQGEKLTDVGRFTYALPDTCAPLGVPADLDLTKLVSCEGVTLTLDNAGRSVTAVVLQNGKQAWSKVLEAKGAPVVTGALPAKAGDVFDVTYLAGKAEQNTLVSQFRYAVPKACALPSIPGVPTVPAVPGVPSVPGVPGLSGLPAANLDLAKNLSCEGVVMTLTNAGKSVPAVLTQNGKQVWQGTVGGAVPSLDTGLLPAKAGDVFAVEYLKGLKGEAEHGKKVELGTFTYALPTNCLPVQVPAVPALPVDLGVTKNVSCEGIVLTLTNAGAPVQALVTRNGKDIWGGTIGGKLDSLPTGMLPAKAGDVFQVSYLTDALPVKLGQKFTWEPSALCSAANLGFDKRLGCDFADVALKHAGTPVQAVVRKNGKEVWSGLVGGATPAVVTDKLPAKAGDVFEVAYAKGDSLKRIGEFTHAVPTSCSLPEATPAAAFTDTCDGVTALLTNPGDAALKLVVQARSSAENAWANVGDTVALPAGVDDAKKIPVPTSLDGTQVRTIVEGSALQVGQLHTWTRSADCSPSVPTPGLTGLDVGRDCKDLTVALPNAAGKEKLVYLVEHTAEAAREYTVLPGDTATYTTPLKAGEQLVVKLGDKVQQLDLTPGRECAAAAPAVAVAPVDAEAPNVQGVTVARGGLPVTGTSLSALLGVAGGLLAVGVFLALIARRKAQPLR
jgi:hypothetical protein